MMKVLICIDYIYNFIADDGTLTTGKNGQLIEDELVNLTRSFIEDNDFAIFATDAYKTEDYYHPENKLSPLHNLIGIDNQKLFGSLPPSYLAQQQPSVYYLTKRYYSAFCGTDLDLCLREQQISERHLAGVCTDISILHTAIDAYNLGYQLVTHEQASASFDAIGHQWTLNHFKQALGATIY
jgi:nicotinamidase-related amidase